MIEIDTTDFDLALAGLEAESKHLVVLVEETERIADTLKMVDNFFMNKEQND